MEVLNQASGKNWILYNGDSCEIIKGVPDASVGLSIFSIPFSTLYIYSDSVADLGNSADHEEFSRHYAYLCGELLRVTKPGRLAVIHCKDLPLYKGRDGTMGLYDFPALLSRVHTECGWTYHSRLTIWKDPVVEMRRTKNHGLLYKEVCKDSCGSRQGMADYLLIFRNWNGDFSDPVHDGERSERFSHYVGMEAPDPTEIANEFGFAVPSADRWGRWPKRNPFPVDSEAYRIWSIHVWRRYASPVWMDIDQMFVLNEKAATDPNDERHICPMQMDVIERCIHLWSNPGDTIFDPFNGIGSTGYVAIKQDRRYLGIELKSSYFEQSLKYLSILEDELNQPSLLDKLVDDQASPVEPSPAIYQMPDPSPVPMVREPVVDEPKARKRKAKKEPTTSMFSGID
jgi:DNA modification methylase